MPKKLWMILIALVGLYLGLVFWLMPHTSKPEQQITSTVPTPQLLLDPEATASTVAFASPSQQDTQINCQLRLDQQQNLIINEQTRHCFEYFISQYGEKKLEQIRQDFVAYIQTGYNPPAQQQIIALWQRYLDYRHALSQIQTPQGEENANYYAQIFAATEKIRQQFFSPIEIQGLFGQEDIYHVYTLQRMQVLENQNLSASEKAAQLQSLFHNLSTDWQDNLQQLTQLEDLRQLSEEIKSRGGNSAELREMRINLVGQEATIRLEQLDQQRQIWQTQVQTYLTERDGILHSHLGDQAKQHAITQLKQQYFPEKTQQLRLETFETIHDQGGQLPFAP